MNTILPALVNGFILSVPLAAAVWLALRVSRRSLNAATRYGVWWIALLASMALPMIFLLPTKPLVKPAQVQGQTQVKNDAQPVPSLGSPDRASDRALVTRPVLPIPDLRVVPRQSVSVAPSIVPSLSLPVRLPSGRWPARIVELWALVSLLLIARLTTSFAILQVRKKNADEASELQKSMERCLAACAVSRRVRIAVVKEGDSPMVAGPFHPCVLIPARLLSALNDTELEQICLHEAAHLARYDDWALLLQRTVEALFVFHPVVRWIARQIDLEREIACDDFVISVTGKARPYASCLAHVAELAVGYSASPVAAAVVDESSHLTRRINMLLDKTRHTGTHILKLRFSTALLALSLLTWFAGKSPVLFALAPQRPVSQSVPVRIRVTVTDPLGRLVTGLEQNNFKVLEDGVEQTISSFDMSDPDSISIKAEVRMQNGVDSLLAAIAGLKARQVNRRAVVIVFNPSDRLVLPENEINAIVRDAMEAGIVVYTVSVTEDEKTPQQTSETSSAGAVLGLLANATGGTQYNASASFTLRAIEERINVELRNQYAIAYVPKNSTANGVYRRIEVSVTPPAGLPPLTARAIPGYYPKSPSSLAQATRLPQPAQPFGERPKFDVVSIKTGTVSAGQAPSTPPPVAPSPAAQSTTTPAPATAPAFRPTMMRAMEAPAFQSVTIQASPVGPGDKGWGIGLGSGVFWATQSLRNLIAFGYDTQGYLISGPDALDAKYHVDASAPGAFGFVDYESIDVARAMVRKMLEDRFHLQVHHGTQSVSAYVLGAVGANVLMTADAENGASIDVEATSIRGSGARMDDFVELLSERLGRPVLDQTGLTQTYDFTVDWKVNALPALPGMLERLVRPTPEVLASALQTQLGLTLTSTTSPVDFLIVDHVEEPSPN